MVYFEDFSTEPVFTFHEGVGDHRFQWNASEGIYEIEHIYDEANIHRYAITPQFQKVENQSFVVQVSLSTKYMTLGPAHGDLFWRRRRLGAWGTRQSLGDLIELGLQLQF